MCVWHILSKASPEPYAAELHYLAGEEVTQSPRMNSGTT